MASTREQLYTTASRALWAGLVLNALLGATKLGGGLHGNSFALIADAINSLGDVLTSIAALVAVRIARRPADARHPYGYSRAEAAVATNIALVVLLSAGWLAVESVRRLTVLHSPPPLWALGIAAANVVLKEAIYQYKARVARRIGSRLVAAAAWDHRSDALSAAAVLVGLGAVRWIGPRAIFADEIAALVVVGFISFASAGLMWRSFVELLDRQAPDEITDAIRETAAGCAGVSAIEKLRVRKSGVEHFVDIHVQVDPAQSVRLAHETAHRVKDRVLAEHASVRDVLVHIEPHEGAAS
ncbi:MAG: cation transporter [Myxococcales bacterium]|nr:cation transporter [Myxococcales bacterium]